MDGAQVGGRRTLAESGGSKMSIRRHENELVLVGRTLYRILPEDWPGHEPYPCFGLNGCDDPDCREWVNLEELDANGNPTGEYGYHVPECEMDTPRKARKK